ncbi:MAG: glycosyl transferase [Microbacterium sp.]|uniref:glycosyl transferase n=1 Tax=Microbacterium sp. TaxID=51671 RepID=UPI0039E33400
MRFVWAVVAFFLAAACIGAGIAQRTVFMGPKTAQTEFEVSGDLPYTLIDGAVLATTSGAQTLVVRGSDQVFAAYGRTVDMVGWLSDSSYNHVVLSGGKTVVEQVDNTPEDGKASEHNPAVSDLWLDQFEEEGELTLPLKLPETMSILIASDGTAPAPSDISVSTPISNSTPWAGPLMVLGGLFLLIGVVLWVLGIRHVRRSRGPRRKGLPAPPTEAIDVADDAAQKGVISAGRRRRAITTGRRGFVVAPAVAVSALLFGGCSADAWPQFGAGASPSPSVSETVIVPEGQQQPAVTEPQAERIIAEVAETVAEADEEKDAKAAAQRLTGPALAERETNYTLRDKVKGQEAPAAIPSKPLAILLPQQFDGWPRTVMSIVLDKDDETVAPTIMLMTQEDPWSKYKVSYLANLEAAAELPQVAPADIGAIQVQPDSPFLVMEPGKLAKAYADVLNKGEKSTYAAMFDLANDHFHSSVAADREERLKAFNKTGKKTGELTFTSKPADTPPLALATLESGAIVAVHLHETDTVKATNEDAVIKLKDNPTVKALAGVSQSATGFTTTFSDQLFFYVPTQGSSEKIRLLGYSSNILSAAVIKKK